MKLLEQRAALRGHSRCTLGNQARWRRTAGRLLDQCRSPRAPGLDRRLKCDLGLPEQVVNEPFESRIEFDRVNFGPQQHAKKARRAGRDAFWWPSPVRIGPEAARLSALSDGTDGLSGLSSPKRYLWDKDPRPEAWVNNRAGLASGEPAPPIIGPIDRRFIRVDHPAITADLAPLTGR